MADNYTCAACGGVFEKAWTDEEALAEMTRDFGEVAPENCAVICDDCYQNVRPIDHPVEMAAYREEMEKR